MKCFPVPKSIENELPQRNKPGSFWEDRNDRYHCGIDIYAPTHSDVLACEDGIIIETGLFTTPKQKKYWNNTYYILLKTTTKLYQLYAELADIVVKKNQKVTAGQLLGHVGTVLNHNKINNHAPSYIQKIHNKKHHSMLHFELYNVLPNHSKTYQGGNSFTNQKPPNLLDPTPYLNQLKNKKKYEEICRNNII